MTDDDVLVRMRGIRKLYNGIEALDGVDLDVRRGEIVGLVGRNGSGKSTLLRHIPGIVLPNDGSCTTFGRDAASLGPVELERLGYVDQEGDLIPFLTVADHVDLVASYYPRWNRELQRRYLQRFDVPRRERVGALSPGIRQQLAVLLAIGFEPDLLVLDEAAAAMDPIARAEFLDLLTELIQDERRAIVLSSHILTDVEKVVDRLVILHEGHVVRDSALDDLRDAYRRVRLTALTTPLPSDFAVPEALDLTWDARTAIFTVRDVPEARLAALAARLGCRMDVAPVPLEEICRLEIAGGEHDG